MVGPGGGMNKLCLGPAPGVASNRAGKGGGTTGSSGVITPLKAVVSVKSIGGEKTATELLCMAKERIPVTDRRLTLCEYVSQLVAV